MHSSEGPSAPCFGLRESRTNRAESVVSEAETPSNNDQPEPPKSAGSVGRTVLGITAAVVANRQRQLETGRQAVCSAALALAREAQQDGFWQALAAARRWQHDETSNAAGRREQQQSRIAHAGQTISSASKTDNSLDEKANAFMKGANARKGFKPSSNRSGIIVVTPC